MVPVAPASSVDLAVVKSGFFHLRRLAKVKRFERGIHAVTTSLDRFL